MSETKLQQSFMLVTTLCSSSSLYLFPLVAASSWAVAAVSAIEYAHAIVHSTSSALQLSFQQVVDCEGTGSCSGGSPQSAFEFAARNPVFTSSQYPYTGRPQACIAKKGVSETLSFLFESWFASLAFSCIFCGDSRFQV